MVEFQFQFNKVSKLIEKGKKLEKLKKAGKVEGLKGMQDVLTALDPVKKVGGKIRLYLPLILFYQINYSLQVVHLNLVRINLPS